MLSVIKDDTKLIYYIYAGMLSVIKDDTKLIYNRYHFNCVYRK